MRSKVSSTSARGHHEASRLRGLRGHWPAIRVILPDPAHGHPLYGQLIVMTFARADSRGLVQGHSKSCLKLSANIRGKTKITKKDGFYLTILKNNMYENPFR